jgi:GTP cyclohydrolase II
VQLVKLSGALPAALIARDTAPMSSTTASIASVDAEAIAIFASATTSMTFVSDAYVPLAAGGTARFVVFRDAFGLEQTAIIVGQPDFSQPVPVRLHSACLTGDVFGSRRCDCGDQLRLALERLQDLGGGIILYLAQEGRGIGLANKMRAYRLQDAGLDTHDANTTLGFHDDERNYDCAALMLHALDCKRINLLTNNPAKLDGLSIAGIEVVARVPLEAPVTDQNRRYLKAKALRSGHALFGIHSPVEDL